MDTKIFNIVSKAPPKGGISCKHLGLDKKVIIADTKELCFGGVDNERRDRLDITLNISIKMGQTAVISEVVIARSSHMPKRVQSNGDKREEIQRRMGSYAMIKRTMLDGSPCFTPL